MNPILSKDALKFLDLVSPEPTEILLEMESLAKERNFPTVGPRAGMAIELLTVLSHATRAFEFGSGFGYSAYWIARGLPPSGSVVLTDRDPNELDLARDFLNRAGFADKAIFETGDAREIFDNYSEQFDLILFDHYNCDYLPDFHAVKTKLRPGGVLIADNAMSGLTVSFEGLLSFFDPDSEDPQLNENTLGTANYLLELKKDSSFKTFVIPLGDGIVVSVSI